MLNTERRLTIRRYLLGFVSEKQRDEFEAGYLADDRLFEEFVAVENALYDSYVSGSLSESERRAFAKQFLGNPQGTERLKFARALLAHSSAPTKSRSATGVQIRPRASAPMPIQPGVQTQGARVLVAGMLLAAILAGGAWILNGRISNQPRLMRNVQQEHQALPAEATKSDAQVDEPEPIRNQRQEDAGRHSTNLGTVSLILSGGLTRSGEQGKTLAIPRSVSHVRLQLNLEHDEYSAYSVLLETAEGHQIWHENSLHAQPLRSGGKGVIVEFAPGILARGDYVLSLTGVTPDGKTEEVCTYNFRVARR